jgi:hypothetical protein
VKLKIGTHEVECLISNNTQFSLSHGDSLHAENCNLLFLCISSNLDVILMVKHGHKGLVKAYVHRDCKGLTHTYTQW